MSTLSTEIASTIDQFCAEWKANDGAALARYFTEDGTLINPFGPRADGRSAVSAMYGDYFNGMLRGTTTRFKLATVRPVEANHVFVDGEQTLYAPDGTTMLVVHVAALMRREGSAWRLVDSRPYVFAALPT
jgi:uncharacterized protein (TIGR02246 family)